MISFMESSVLGSNWSFFYKASRSGWATLAGSCRLACCPHNVLTAAQLGIHGGCVLNWCGVGTGTHKLRSRGAVVQRPGGQHLMVQVLCLALQFAPKGNFVALVCVDDGRQGTPNRHW